MSQTSPNKSAAQVARERLRDRPASFYSRARDVFGHFSRRVAGAMGSPWAFAIASLSIIIWAVLGPKFEFSNTWQLIINTGTTIITFLMVFLIQNTQNRDSRAVHMKLDEIIRSLAGARNELVDLEDCTEHEIERFEAEFRKLRDDDARSNDPNEAADDPEQAPH